MAFVNIFSWNCCLWYCCLKFGRQYLFDIIMLTLLTVVSDWLLLLWQNERYTSLLFVKSTNVDTCNMRFGGPFHKTNPMRWLMEFVLCNWPQPAYQFIFSNIGKIKDFKIRTRSFYWSSCLSQSLIQNDKHKTIYLVWIHSDYSLQFFFLRLTFN